MSIDVEILARLNPETSGLTIRLAFGLGRPAAQIRYPLSRNDLPLRLGVGMNRKVHVHSQAP
jgi:hypothetical protein